MYGRQTWTMLAPPAADQLVQVAEIAGQALLAADSLAVDCQPAAHVLAGCVSPAFASWGDAVWEGLQGLLAGSLSFVQQGCNASSSWQSLARLAEWLAQHGCLQLVQPAWLHLRSAVIQSDRRAFADQSLAEVLPLGALVWGGWDLVQPG